jgi:hypothetical protein
MHDRPAHYAGEKKALGFRHRLASFHAAWKRPGSAIHYGLIVRTKPLPMASSRGELTPAAKAVGVPV